MSLCFSLSGTTATLVRARVVCFVLAAGCLGVWTAIFLPSFLDVVRKNDENAEAGWTKYYRADLLQNNARHTWQDWRIAMIAYYSLRTVGYALVPTAVIFAGLARWRNVHLLTGHVFSLAGLLTLIQGCSDLWAVSMLFASGLQRTPWFVAGVFIIGLFASVTGSALLMPQARRDGQAAIILLARALSRTSSSDVPEASLAPLLGLGTRRGERKADELVADALCVFTPIVLTAEMLRTTGLHAAFDRTSSRKRSSSRGALRTARTRLRSQSVLPTSNAAKLDVVPTADCYVVYSPSASAAANLAALTLWVANFEREHRRSPSVWIDVLCADVSLTSIELLEHMPVYLARSKRLLLLASAKLTERLWSAMECWTWFVLGRQIESIDVVIVRLPGVEVRHAISAFDSFHVMWSLSSEGPAVRRRLEHAVELASVQHFNAKLRELTPLVQRAAELQHQPQQVLASASRGPTS